MAHTSRTTSNPSNAARKATPAMRAAAKAKASKQAKAAPQAPSAPQAQPAAVAALANAPLGTAAVQPVAGRATATAVRYAPAALLASVLATQGAGTALAVLAPSCPKRAGTAAATAWALYSGCATVGAYTAAVAAYVAAGQPAGLLHQCSNALANLRWDWAHGYVAVGGATYAQACAALAQGAAPQAK